MPEFVHTKGHSGSTLKGVLVSWEREQRPSPDAETLPRDSILRPDWRKFSVRAGEAWHWIAVSCLRSRRMPQLNHSAPLFSSLSHMWYSFKTSVRRIKTRRGGHGKQLYDTSGLKDYSVELKTPLLWVLLPNQGQNHVQSPSGGPDNNLQSVSCQLSSGPTSKISPLPSDRKFGIRPECLPSSCIGQFQQQNNRMGLNQSKPRFLGPNAQGKSFGINSVAGVQHHRATADLHSSGLPTQSLGGSVTNVSLGWGSAHKQVTTGLSVRRLPNPLQLQGVQDLPNHLYQQRHVGPPNQVARDVGMFPLNPLLGDAGQPRPSQAMMGCPSPLGNLSQASPEQRVPAASFPDASPSSSSYQNNRSNRLTFDFLPEGDNTVPGINADSDFIDSLLKSGSGNDDWMKDINLDEILGSHS
ncbi:hypothetical protein XENOCAPTIV_028822 [Xenoophorus captivus]|uniref:Mastermind-like protein 2 n=1 Tax=Xenoophorus captivus TaxID=1517983 RepID=A0ABV0R5D8_9TELE